MREIGTLRCTDNCKIFFLSIDSGVAFWIRRGQMSLRERVLSWEATIFVFLLERSWKKNINTIQKEGNIEKNNNKKATYHSKHLWSLNIKKQKEKRERNSKNFSYSSSSTLSAGEQPLNHLSTLSSLRNHPTCRRAPPPHRVAVTQRRAPPPHRAAIAPRLNLTPTTTAMFLLRLQDLHLQHRN